LPAASPFGSNSARASIGSQIELATRKSKSSTPFHAGIPIVTVDEQRELQRQNAEALRTYAMTHGPIPLQMPSTPPGWGLDGLSSFWEAARNNQFGTFVNKRPIFEKLVGIDNAFTAVSKDWLNPNDTFAALLFLRCHVAFKTASGLAAAGQAAEAYVMHRSMLEYAALALHINRNPKLRQVWLDRQKDEASKKASRNAFWHGKIKKTVVAVNPHAGKRFEDLYQWTIDLGAHPNERSVTGNMKMVDEAGRRTMQTISQHADGPPLDLALKRTAQCGVCSLEIFQGIFNTRFELLGVNATILELRKGL
jgi:hypothetical protein